MSLSRYAVVDSAGAVSAVVMWDGASAFDPGDALKLTIIQPGWDVIDGKLAELPAPAAAAPAVPQSVSMVQAQLALFATPSPKNSGKTLLDDVNAAVDASTDQRVKIAWTKGTIVERDGLFVSQIAAMIPGLDTQAERDALFVAAGQIVT